MILGWPVVLKTRRNRYDGKRNCTLKSQADVAVGWQAFGGGKNELMGQAFFPLAKDLAVIVTRGRDGGLVTYPFVETLQHNHVCHVVKAPAQVSDELSKRAAALAKHAIKAVGGVGSFGVEMFLAGNGELAINELAPRVHNSGHYTIEAYDCSQFANHVRAVLGWPLGNPLMLAPTAVMVNLLGTEKSHRPAARTGTRHAADRCARPHLRQTDERCGTQDGPRHGAEKFAGRRASYRRTRGEGNFI